MKCNEKIQCGQVYNENHYVMFLKKKCNEKFNTVYE